MEQHPVPQQISSYQFHLVGDMTLKQFLELAGGVGVAVLFYATGLPIIIKLPLILISIGIGAAMAFVPYEDRPLEQWFGSFFRSIYSPTIFSWQKTAVPSKIFQDETQVEEVQPISSKPKVPFLSNLEETENKFLSTVTQLFVPATPQPTPVTTNTPTFKPVPETTQPFVPQKPRLVVEEKVTLPGINPDIAPLKQTITTKPTIGIETVFSAQAAPPAPPILPNTVVGQVIDPDGGIVEGAILEVRDALGRPVRALKTNKAGYFMIVTPLMDGKYELITEKEGLIFDSIRFEANGILIPPIAVRARARQVVAQEVKA